MTTTAEAIRVLLDDQQRLQFWDSLETPIFNLIHGEVNPNYQSG